MEIASSGTKSIENIRCCSYRCPLSFFYQQHIEISNGIFIGIDLTTKQTWNAYIENYQLLLCYNDPDSHPFITDYEKAYLLEELGQQQQHHSKQLTNGNNQRKPTKQTPWRQILTNVPFIALILCQVSYISTDWPNSNHFPLYTIVFVRSLIIVSFNLSSSILHLFIFYIAIWTFGWKSSRIYSFIQVDSTNFRSLRGRNTI